MASGSGCGGALERACAACWTRDSPWTQACPSRKRCAWPCCPPLSLHRSTCHGRSAALARVSSHSSSWRQQVSLKRAWYLDRLGRTSAASGPARSEWSHDRTQLRGKRHNGRERIDALVNHLTRSLASPPTAFFITASTAATASIRATHSTSAAARSAPECGPDGSRTLARTSSRRATIRTSLLLLGEFRPLRHRRDSAPQLASSRHHSALRSFLGLALRPRMLPPFPKTSALFRGLYTTSTTLDIPIGAAVRLVHLVRTTGQTVFAAVRLA
jgi:hypothetical protein